MRQYCTPPPPLFSETGSPTLLILRSVFVPAPIFLSRPVDMPLLQLFTYPKIPTVTPKLHGWSISIPTRDFLLLKPLFLILMWPIEQTKWKLFFDHAFTFQSIQMTGICVILCFRLLSYIIMCSFYGVKSC